MPPVTPVVLALVALAVAPRATPLPRGDGHFRLGMARAQVDSAAAARGLAVVSSGATFLVFASDDPAVEYEHYSFFRAPHDVVLLWRVALGYRLDASHDDFARVRSDLASRLGDPTSDTGTDTDSWATGRDGPRPAERRVVWADASTVVRLGGRWRDGPRQPADRMLVTWSDRRLQRLVEAGRKRDRGKRQR